MAFFRDILEASQGFKEAAQGFSRQRAFHEAEERADALKAQEMNQFEANLEREKIARRLQQELTALETPVSQVQLAGATFGPQAPKSSEEDILNSFLTEGEQADRLLKRGTRKARALQQPSIDAFEDKQAIKMANDIALLKLKQANEAEGLKIEDIDRINELSRKSLSEFTRLPGVKKLLQARPEAGKIEAFLDAGNDPSTITGGIKSLIKLSGEERISDPDFRNMQVNPSLRNKAKRAYNVFLKNERLPEDAEVLRTMTRALVNRIKSTVDNRIISFAEGQSRDIRGLDAKRLEETLRLKLDIMDEKGATRESQQSDIAKFRSKAFEAGLSSEDIEAIEIATEPEYRNSPGAQKLIQRMRRLFKDDPSALEHIDNLLESK